LELKDAYTRLVRVFLQGAVIVAEDTAVNFLRTFISTWDAISAKKLDAVGGLALPPKKPPPRYDKDLEAWPVGRKGLDSTRQAIESNAMRIRFSLPFNFMLEVRSCG
jgi:hypothetical protein